MTDNSPPCPTGTLTLRTLAMPSDANAAGDIFGGWVMAQMDLACGIRAAEHAGGRVVTAAVNEMVLKNRCMSEIRSAFISRLKIPAALP